MTLNNNVYIIYGKYNALSIWLLLDYIPSLCIICLKIHLKS